MKELKGVDENTLPKKWAIKTDRQEFYDWVNANKFQCDVDALPVFLSETLVHINLESDYSLWFATDTLNLGYELITFEIWASVYRPDLVNTPEIPERWCVRRTPENAEILNAWQCQRLQEKCYTSDTGYIHDQGSSDEIPYDYCIFEKTTTKHTEITFDQWQTIPEVSEWLNLDPIGNRLYMLHIYKPNVPLETDNFRAEQLVEAIKSINQPIEVEEREIIGYEAPRDLFGKRIKAGTVFTKCAITTVSFEYIHGQTILPAEWVETWKPVYAEKPVFKVGDYATFKGNDTFKISRITEHYLHAEGGFGYLKECCTVATPEEIEAAKPKRKYMKQVWYVLVMDENFNSLMVSKQHETEEEAHQWELENSEEGLVYSVKPFEVVAYE